VPARVAAQLCVDSPQPTVNPVEPLTVDVGVHGAEAIHPTLEEHHVRRFVLHGPLPPRCPVSAAAKRGFIVLRDGHAYAPIQQRRQCVDSKLQIVRPGIAADLQQTILGVGVGQGLLLRARKIEIVDGGGCAAEAVSGEAPDKRLHQSGLATALRRGEADAHGTMQIGPAPRTHQGAAPKVNGQVEVEYSAGGRRTQLRRRIDG
jgi:hypothetical protein